MSATEGLPRQFLSSLRILFDILDENRTGLVRLCDIESRWSDDGVRGLPPGVVEGLRKVTPPSGMLSFERFVAGLKLVLASKRPESNDNDIVESRKPFVAKENRMHSFVNQRDRSAPFKQDNAANNKNRMNSDGQPAGGKPLYSPRDTQPLHGASVQNSNYIIKPNPAVVGKHRDRRFEGSSVTADAHRKFQPNFSAGHQKPREPSYTIKPDVSYPNSAGSHHAPSSAVANHHRQTSGVSHFRHAASSTPSAVTHSDKPPAIPPRTDRPTAPDNVNNSNMKRSQSGPDLPSRSPPAVPPRERESSTRVLNELKNWQKEWTEGTKSDRAGLDHRPNKKSEEIYANIQQFQTKFSEDQNPPLQSGPQKATVRRHGSGRRHTLADGIDQNMLKRMKQLEEETAILRAGLAMVDSAREWYRKQLASVSDKQGMLGKVSYNDNSVEAYQERMNFQKARIAEVNQHLRLLVESSEKGFPLHMNLAVASSRVPGGDANLRALTEHNRRLMDELNQNREQMSQLEKEKSSLVRELFEARSKHQQPNYDDTTFM